MVSSTICGDVEGRPASIFIYMLLDSDSGKLQPETYPQSYQMEYPPGD